MGAGGPGLEPRRSLVRDPYTGAAKGEVELTLNYLWNFGLPRTGQLQTPQVRQQLGNAEPANFRAGGRWED